MDWFKRQLFGRKSEKVLPDNPAQSSLFASATPDEVLAVANPVNAHTRSSKKQRNDADRYDEGLRFDETVPQQIIERPAPELQGPDADQYEIVDIKETLVWLSSRAVMWYWCIVVRWYVINPRKP
ncbi:transposase [Alteromonas pelagimontana]|uniref:transposase n=1 Tax=Alteromonas pelagimontana TaxID=1858656 RepID=UPI001E4169CF|nr:transposase [Alteromonas pelagimontana]